MRLLTIALLLSAACFAQTDEPGPLRALPDEAHTTAEGFGGWNAAQVFWAGLRAPATSGIGSGTYVSGITATGSATQTCTLASFNGGNSGGTATVALTGTNAIAGGTALVVTASGTGSTGPATSATAANGTATCSGTAVVATAVANLVWTVPAMDGNSGVCWGWASAYTLGWVSCGGGSSYWTLTGSNLAPVGNYNLLPTGSATVGNATNYWTQSFSVQDYAGTYYIVYGSYPFNIQGWIGWDATNSQIAVLNTVGGASWEFGNGTVGTKANVSYNDLLPSATNMFYLGGASLRWEGYFDSITVNSCTGCGGASYWTLSSPNLAPSGNYNLLPTGSATFGNPTNYWTQSFSVQDYAGTYYIVFGTYPFNVQGWVGWDSGSSQIAVVTGAGGATWEFGNGTLGTKSNVTYNPIVPSVANSIYLGGASLRFEGYFDNINVNSCTGCPSGGSVTSVATTSPITGGTFTTTGTVGCGTCLTTAGGQTITASDTFTHTIFLSSTAGGTEIQPTNDFWSLGDSSHYFSQLYIYSSIVLESSIGVVQWGPSDTANLNSAGGATFTSAVTTSSSMSAGIYDINGGFFGQTLTGGLSVTTSGGVCKVFFEGGIVYAFSGTPSTGAACI